MTANKTTTHYQSILNFMQSEDPNGDWLTLTETTENKLYILSIMNEWVDDGIALTPRIQYYIDYLSK